MLAEKLPLDRYERHKAAARERIAGISAEGRDIGSIPSIRCPDRRDACRGDILLFGRTYFPAAFALEFSDDHKRVAELMRTCIETGGLFAMAMPRGSGKTTLCEVAVLYATLYGFRRYVVLIGADASKAVGSLESIKTEIESNELLAEDFPEVCYPVSKLERIANRCKGQTSGGDPTYLQWSGDQIVFPTVAGSATGGTVVKAVGLTASIRGLKHKTTDGEILRPDLAVVDDPQTDESANSPSQCAARERLLTGAVLGLAGPGQRIAALMPCTVIRRGDLADVMLDRKRHPEWQGVRTKLVYEFPTDETLWTQYAEIRADGMRRGDGGAAGTEFYRSNRAAMDAGARVAWDQRYNPDEISAVQHAINLRLQDEAAFWSEYQNEPQANRLDEVPDLTADQITSQLNRLNRGAVPLKADRLTAFVDVQGAALYWVVSAWAPDCTGSVVDYGCYPDPGREYFALRDLTRTLRTEHGDNLEGAIHAGLTNLLASICGRGWIREDGAELRLGKVLIDANWGTSQETVYAVCRTSEYASILTPSHGRYVGASTVPLGEYSTKPGETVGHNWRHRYSANKAVRYLIFDTNYWKSFVFTRLATAVGAVGSLTLFGDRPSVHRLFVDHLTAEYRVKTTGRGREVDEWKQRPDRRDNHWLDGLAGTAVAASMLGVSLDAIRPAPTEPRKQISFAEMQATARRRRIGQHGKRN